MEKYATLPRAKPVTWILVADGRQARIYTRSYAEKSIPLPGNAKHHHYEEGHAHELVPVPGADFLAESAQHYDFNSKQLGRVHESANSAHHMSEPRETVGEKIKRQFMETIAGHLKVAHQAKLFERLVLVAPAKALGELKESLSREVLGCVAAELPKDLTHCETRALAEHLENIA
jgi:protein required for attachment to host cells